MANPTNGKPDGSSAVIQLNSTKAGMEGLDVDAINAIINEASKGSKFYEHKIKQQKEVARKLEEMSAKLASFTEAAIAASEKEMDKYGEELERSRDYSRFIVHIDMDAYYAAVEMRDNPDLKDKPMAVGGNSMLSTSNYVARKFGVRAAMPGFIAKKLCPQLIIVPCNFDKYRAVSKQVHEILKDYDPNFSTVSLDEAYLDITDYVTEKQVDPEDVVREMRKRIYEDTQLTASAGIASNGFLAKICGDICKPNNQYLLPKTREAEAKFLNPIAIRKINGIGSTMEQLLHGFQIFTAEDIWKKRGIINLLFKPLTAKWLIRVSKGYDHVSEHGFSESDRKSISSETTLDRSTSDIEKMLGILQEIAKELENDLETRNMKCKQVAVKIKTDKFEVKTRSRQLLNFTDRAEEIFASAKIILEGLAREEQELCVRLLGIRVAKWNRQDTEEGELEPLKKQPRIDSFFRKPIAAETGDSTLETAAQGAGETFLCPICNKYFSSEAAISQHIDECLVATNGFEGSSQPDIVDQGSDKTCLPENANNVPLHTLMKKAGAPKKPVTLDQIFEVLGRTDRLTKEAKNESGLTARSNGVKTPSSLPSSSTSVSVNHSKVPEVTRDGTSTCNGSTVISSPYTCPVCNRSILSLKEPHIVSYNEHVELCLLGELSTAIPPFRWIYEDSQKTNSDVADT